MKKMGIFILLMIGVLFISHYKNVKPVKAAPTLDESTQETTTVGEPRNEEPEATELETAELEAAEPQEKTGKKEKKKEAAADEEAEEQSAEESEEITEEQPVKSGKVFNRDEIGAILVCILFCVAFMCGYFAASIVFKGL